MKTLFRLTALSALPLLLAGCITQGELDSLHSRMNEQERKMQSLSSQVGNVEQVLPGQAEMWAQMQAMRNELNQVRGQLDELTAGGVSGAQIAELKMSQARLEGVVRRIAAQFGVSVDELNAPVLPPAVETPGTNSTVGTTAPVTPTTTPTTTTRPETTEKPATPPPAGSSDTATNLYNSGMSAFSSGKYAQSVKAFTDFTKAFPSNKLASNAHFWRGESYYQLKDFAGAALAYQQVIEKFPGSAKFQAAMLKQGMAFYYAGKKDAGRLRLNELIKKYPSSPEAGMAKTFLQKNK